MIQTPLFTTNTGRVLSTFTPRITMLCKRLCAFLRRLIGRSPALPTTEVRAAIRGELIDLVVDETIQQPQTPTPAEPVAPKPVQKQEPRPAAAPIIQQPRKKPVRYGGRAQYPMRRRGTRGK